MSSYIILKDAELTEGDLWIVVILFVICIIVNILSNRMNR